MRTPFEVSKLSNEYGLLWAIPGAAAAVTTRLRKKIRFMVWSDFDEISGVAGTAPQAGETIIPEVFKNCQRFCFPQNRASKERIRAKNRDSGRMDNHGASKRK